MTRGVRLVPIGTREIPLVVAVHGVATTDAEFAEALVANLGQAGLDVEVIPAMWSSRGSLLSDVSGLLTSKVFRETAIDNVMNGIALGLRRAIDEARPFTILAHSAGAVLAVEAVRRLRAEGLTMVAVGSPFSHPVWGPALRSLVGLGHEGPFKVAYEFWNAEDAVCCTRWLGARGHRDLGLGWRSERVAFAGRGTLDYEHTWMYYAANKRVAQAVNAAAVATVRIELVQPEKPEKPAKEEAA